MKNKIVAEIGVGIILLIAIMIGGIFWMQGRQSQTATQPAPVVPVQIAKKEALPVKKSSIEEKKIAQTIKTEDTAASEVGKSADSWKYKSDKWGFQMELTKKWGEYKVEESGSFTPGYYYVSFSIPYANNIEVYVSVLTIVIADVEEYEKNGQRCKTEPDPGCPDPSRVLARTSKYVYEWSFPQDIPIDVYNGNDFTFDKVKSGFSIL